MLLSEAIRKDHRTLTDVSVCPYIGCGDHRTFGDMLGHLTFKHGWHRGQIADWVAEQEKRLGITEDS